jgi:hypothetical protein
VGEEGFLRSNADRLADALAGSRQVLPAVDESERTRRQDAIDHFSRYVELLRQTTATTVARYSFKREFADGRWDVTETELPNTPHVGDLVWFEDGGGPWQIRGLQLVPRPVGTTQHEFFDCAPAAFAAA